MNPTVAGPSLIYQPPNWVERLDWGQVFGNSRPVEIDLGCGRGRFLLATAAVQRERNFLGVDRLLGRLRRVDARAQRQGLANVRLLRIEAAYCVGYLVPLVSVATYHLYFPDPWPKRKHRRHRLINERFPALAAQSLAPGGAVYLRTDDQFYFDQMTAVFAASPAFRPADTPAELAGLLTDFERDFAARGIPTRRATYLLV